MLEDKNTLVVGAMHYYLAPAGTPAPTTYEELVKPKSPWEELGHTGRETPLSITREGGEATVLGTAQNASLRTITKRSTQSLELTLHQFDEATYRFFMGENIIKDGAMSYASDTPEPVETALLGVAYDGSSVLGIHAYRCETTANGDFSFNDPENLSGVPVKFTALGHEGKPSSFGLTPIMTKPASGTSGK